MKYSKINNVKKILLMVSERVMFLCLCWTLGASYCQASITVSIRLV